MNSLVSIIIPTFNRAHLIGETLDSVIAQTYQNWECIVIDDGSRDYTGELMEFYCILDKRIRYHIRPKEKPKGANTCRNYGFEISSGKYINWFDSDDLMSPHKIEIQLTALLESGKNFAVDRHENFDVNGSWEEALFEENLKCKIEGRNYILHTNFWITINVLLKRDLFESNKIRFDSYLKSGQEYNFFTKLLVTGNVDIIYINQALSLHRVHKASIQGEQRADTNQYLINKYTLFFKTYSDIKHIKDRNIKLFMLKNCQSFAFRLALLRKVPPHITKMVSILLIEIGIIKTLMFSQSIILGLLFRKGYRISKKSYAIMDMNSKK